MVGNEIELVAGNGGNLKSPPYTRFYDRRATGTVNAFSHVGVKRP
jgi:hypothetical protein